MTDVAPHPPAAPAGATDGPRPGAAARAWRKLRDRSLTLIRRRWRDRPRRRSGGDRSGLLPIAALVLMLASGLALGLWTSWRVLASGAGPGALAYGPWIVWHRAGAADADPYSLAGFARRGDIPMAPGEGMALFATRDDGGAELDASCHYEIGGLMPAARAWTLAAYRPDGRLLDGPSARSGFTSAEALVEDGRVRIALAPDPQPGNWLPLAPGAGRFVLALRLYETPLSAVSAALDAARLPRLTRIGCR